MKSPQKIYECMGDVPNVVFPGATSFDPSTGRIVLYYGDADTVTALAFTYLDDVIDFVKRTTVSRVRAAIQPGKRFHYYIFL